MAECTDRCAEQFADAQSSLDSPAFAECDGRCPKYEPQ
jgi:hypothetical protein